ncbi:MAG: energy transducer TonB [Myxococcota bacterium]|nr:energy transducer TonB [Myxococcota bacterium]
MLGRVGAWALACLLLSVAASAQAPQDPVPNGNAAAAPIPKDLPHVDAAPLGPTAAERLAEIRRRVQEAVVYPPIARKRSVYGEVEVGFRIGPSGTPEEITVLRSSGSASLDRAAERAVRDAAPLPRMIGRVRVPVRFALREE